MRDTERVSATRSRHGKKRPEAGRVGSDLTGLAAMGSEDSYGSEGRMGHGPRFSIPQAARQAHANDILVSQALSRRDLEHFSCCCVLVECGEGRFLDRKRRAAF